MTPASLAIAAGAALGLAFAHPVTRAKLGSAAKAAASLIGRGTGRIINIGSSF